MKPEASLRVVLFCAAFVPGPRLEAETRPVTVDDLMRLRSMSDVRISPDGQRVAYVVSQPSVEKNAHEAVLHVVPAAGGPATRMTYGTRIFNKPRPVPHLRWSPDGTSLAFIALVDDAPQVVVLAVGGGEARPVTTDKEGTTSFEWSPDGQRLAYLAPDPVPEEEERRKKEAESGGFAGAMAEGFRALFEGMFGDVGENDVLLKVTDKGSKIFGAEVFDASGKKVDGRGSMKMSGFWILNFGEKLPQDASLRIYVLTPKALVSAPFSLKDVTLP